MITEATGIPDADTSAATTASEPATQPAATTQEPSQEAVLSELRTARKEGKELDFSAATPKSPEPAKAEPPKDPAQNSNEQKLKAKHGDNYMPRKERKDYRTKIDSISQRLAELESKWKGPAPTADNQLEFTEDNFEYKMLTKEFNEKLGEYKAEIRAELESKYNSDETFKAQHDHWGDMVFSETEGAGELTDFMMTQPNGIQILSNLYKFLDTPAGLETWLHTTQEQRMSAVKAEAAKMRYAPRVPATPATTTPAPAAAATPAAGTALPTIPMTVKPNPAGTGGGAGLDLNKQEDCLKLVRQKRKEMM